MGTVTLPATCLVCGTRPRLAYGHACGRCDPLFTPAPATRCQRPLRCYCDATPECLGHPDRLPTWAKPGPPPPEVRDQLAELRRRRHAAKSERTPA